VAAHDPNGWRKMTCDYCGRGSEGKVYISILIATDDPDSEYPYTQTEMCYKCWIENGIKAVLEHNTQFREDCGCPIRLTTNGGNHELL
jgi:hypothetical protein